MKDLKLLIWLTQLALSVVSPLLGFALLAIWLHKGCGWGQWIIWLGAVLGAYSAVRGLIDSLRMMDKHGKDEQELEEPSLSFNDHE